ncbi:MAG: hypothetical protein JST61_01635 [Acidobacteria bacterium]|nr:hypothetical protein [Acidobacteriota bacterium]
MLTRNKLKALIIIYLLGAVALSIRVPVVQTDVFDQVAGCPDSGIPGFQWDDCRAKAVGNSVPPNAWTRAWIWERGLQYDGSQVRVRWKIVALENFALLMGVVIALFKRQKLDPFFDWLERSLWLFPLAAYAIAATLRLIYVPCLYVVSRAYGWRPERASSITLPLWQIDAQQVRYGLVLFEELVLLLLVISVYAMMFVFNPSLRTRIFQRTRSL